MKKPQRSASRARSQSKSRYARGWETRRKNAAAREAKAYQASKQADMAMSRAAQNPAAQPAGDAWLPMDKHEELVAMLMPLARKKDGAEIMLKMLRHHVGHECAQAVEIADRGSRALFQKAARREADRVVCGFISEVAIAMKQHGGKMPDGVVFNVAGVIAEKVVKALGLAGYKADGFFGERERIGEMAIERNEEKRERGTDRFAI